MDDPRAQVMEAIDDGELTVAEGLLRGLVEDDADDADLWLMLTLVRSDLGDGDGARTAAGRLLGLVGDHPRAQWAAGVAALTAKRHDEAEQRARFAIELGDQGPSPWALLARVAGERGDWAASLEAAENALTRDPEHLPSANYRALALRQLRRFDEADAAFAELAAAAPLSAFSNAGLGWSLLRRGARADAEESFREALRLEPDSVWAREGLLTAIKAKNPLYRAMLKYFQWMEMKTPRERWIFAIGGLLIFNGLREISDARPALRPLIWPAIGLYAVFLFTTWLAEPLSNLTLMGNARARRLLGADRTVGALAVGACLLVGVGIGVAAAALRSAELGVFAIPFLFLLIPISAAFQCPEGWPRTTMVGYAAALALCALATFVVGEDLRWALFGIVAIGSIAASWITRAVIAHADRRRRSSARQRRS